MNRTEQGFILLYCLGLMMAVSLLVLSIRHQLWLSQKNINTQAKASQDLYHLEDMASQLLEKVSIDPRCLWRENSVNEVSQKLISGQGCSLTMSTSHFRYLVEDLGKFPCMVVFKDEDFVASHHYRLSLLLIDQEEPKSWLQIRYIRPAVFALPCLGERRTIGLGISSWRYIVAVG